MEKREAQISKITLYTSNVLREHFYTSPDNMLTQLLSYFNAHTEHLTLTLTT